MESKVNENSLCAMSSATMTNYYIAKSVSTEDIHQSNSETSHTENDNHSLIIENHQNQSQRIEATNIRLNENSLRRDSIIRRGRKIDNSNDYEWADSIQDNTPKLNHHRFEQKTEFIDNGNEGDRGFKSANSWNYNDTSKIISSHQQLFTTDSGATGYSGSPLGRTFVHQHRPQTISVQSNLQQQYQTTLIGCQSQQFTHIKRYCEQGWSNNYVTIFRLINGHCIKKPYVLALEHS